MKKSVQKDRGSIFFSVAGFDYSNGEVIITSDAYLQNNPQDFGIIIKKNNEDYDIVSGWRHKRKDKFLTRACLQLSPTGSFLVSLESDSTIMAPP